MATIQPRNTQASGTRSWAIPLSPEEEQSRILEAIKALDEVAEMGDEEEQRATFETLKKAIDEDRLSYRARFAE